MTWVFWITCGILVYGLAKGDALNREELRRRRGCSVNNYNQYSWGCEILLISFAAFGFYALVTNMIFWMIDKNCFREYQPRLCFRMPREYCR